jgi:hypothetical protein
MSVGIAERRVGGFDGSGNKVDWDAWAEEISADLRRPGKLYTMRQLGTFAVGSGAIDRERFSNGRVMPVRMEASPFGFGSVAREVGHAATDNQVERPDDQS